MNWRLIGGLGALGGGAAALAAAYLSPGEPPAVRSEAAAPVVSAPSAPTSAPSGSAGAAAPAVAGAPPSVAPSAPPSAAGVEVGGAPVVQGGPTTPSRAQSLGAVTDAAPIEVRPQFDVVRVERDGSAIVAGRAQPDAMVRVVIDGETAAEIQADDRGEFVALLPAPTGPVSEPRSFALHARNRDGVEFASESPVIVTAAVSVTEAPLVVRPTPDGPELMQPPPAPAAGAISIDTISYAESGAVQVTGRGQPGELARVYLDGDLEAETTVDAEGQWRAELDESVEPSIYTLRVDQIREGGKVSARAETPFERAAVSDIVLAGDGVVVQPGNNLWRIASFVYGDGFRYDIIYRENSDQIRDPDLIYPGQVFTLPDEAN